MRLVYLMYGEQSISWLPRVCSHELLEPSVPLWEKLMDVVTLHIMFVLWVIQSTCENFKLSKVNVHARITASVTVPPKALFTSISRNHTQTTPINLDKFLGCLHAPCTYICKWTWEATPWTCLKNYLHLVLWFFWGVAKRWLLGYNFDQVMSSDTVHHWEDRCSYVLCVSL